METVEVYIQHYQKYNSITLEMPVGKGRMYKIFGSFVSTWKKLKQDKLLVSKSTLHYNGKHLLQIKADTSFDYQKWLGNISGNSIVDIHINIVGD